MPYIGHLYIHRRFGVILMTLIHQGALVGRVDKLLRETASQKGFVRLDRVSGRKGIRLFRSPPTDTELIGPRMAMSRTSAD